MMLTTNEKIIKLWQVSQRSVKTVSTNMHSEVRMRTRIPEHTTSPSLRLPTLTPVKNVVMANSKRVFASGHIHHINSLSLCPDQEHYLSADDLRINLWNLSVTDEVFQIVDLQPSDLEQLSEIITTCEAHPVNSSLFAYATTRGSVRLIDTRQRALHDSPALNFDTPSAQDNFFSEVMHHIGSIKFLKDKTSDQFVTRDYFSVKLWDVRQPQKPIRSISVHEHLRPRLLELYENEALFDRFKLVTSASGSHFLTGSYNNVFHIYDSNGTVDTAIEASRSLPKRGRRSSKRTRNLMQHSHIDFNKKIIHCDWHPTEDTIAIATLSNLFIYSAIGSSSSSSK
ncbi:hypothetical protein PCE1_001239 [Barthelona sp. PCE]